MDCSEIQPNIMDYSLGQLTHSETEEVRSHLIICEECRKVLEEERTLAQRFGEMDQAAPRNDVWTLVRSRTRPRSDAFRVMQTRVARLVAAFAATAAVVITVMSFQPDKAPSPADRDSIRAVTVIMTSQQHDTTVDDPLGTNADALAAAIDEGT